MDDHVTEHLSALLDGELPEAERARVEGHLSACPACAAERDLLASSLKSIAALPAAVEPSPALRRAVLAAVDAEPEGLLARLRSLLSLRLLVPVGAAAVAGAVLFVAARPHDGGLAADLAVAERLDLLQDYDVVALAMPQGVAASDLDVVAHLDELGD